MHSTPSAQYRPDPELYLRLGELIASSGAHDFAERMFRLVDAQVPINRLEFSEWTLDPRQASVSQVKALGSAGAPVAGRDSPRSPLLPSIMRMDDPLLIKLKTPLHTRHAAHQCHLVSRSGDRRWVICVQRLPGEQAFSLAELSQLKTLSDTLLPLVEHHGQWLAHSVADHGSQIVDLDAGSLRRAFAERLAQHAVKLSLREQEVCLGLLTGATVPEMAQRLSVKNSSAETYLKRATAKLGVSGRHGLAKWMAGA
ncbi:helix-turn-helix transcriptional regulator [Pseudomonas sp.]|uniref:helix-turn-helix transcriptional regulator n=1 Tax=Pseudomonas sp. TaxID=306 RepID=UPI0028A76A39|nr:helix-turn-helix transcriptional regulator [Pseudomonas sp.]